MTGNKANNKPSRMSSRILALLLAAVMTFALAGCKSSPGSYSADVSEGVAGITYHHFESDDFYAMCDELEQASEAGDADKVLSLYDDLYDQCVELETMYSVVYVMYSSDVTSDYYTDEQQYSYETLIDCADRMCEVCRGVTEGPCADAFHEHVGDMAYEAFAEYDVMSEREKELVKKENSLVDEYYKIMDEADSYTYEYNGVEYTLDMISGDEGSALASSDYSGYIEVYDGVLKLVNDAAGPIFIELVGIRNELAQIRGYDNYAVYADAESYNRDYSEEEIRQLYADVKKISGTFYDGYYASYYSGESDSVPEMSQDKLFSVLRKYAPQISPLAGDAATALIDEKLISIGDEDCRQDGAYTTYIRLAHKPFMSITMEGQRDFFTLTHEFGHFIEFSNEEQQNILTDEDNIDLAEIASNGFEGLMTRYYDEIFGKDAEAAEKMVIRELMFNVLDGCMDDEFQRAVYETPGLTLDEINALYSKIYAEYNHYAEGDPGYSWVYISHNYESPMYYISYAVSGLAALQIWNQSKEDFDAAVATWEKFIEEGTYNNTYLDVIGRCGLIKFTEAGAIDRICGPALELTSEY